MCVCVCARARACVYVFLAPVSSPGSGAPGPSVCAAVLLASFPGREHRHPTVYCMGMAQYSRVKFLCTIRTAEQKGPFKKVTPTGGKRGVTKKSDPGGGSPGVMTPPIQPPRKTQKGGHDPEKGVR